MNIVEKAKAFLTSKNNRTKLVLAVGIIGIALILLSEFSPVSESASAESESVQVDYISYVNGLDEQLSEIISSMDGVGECKVMITLKATAESVYATDEENSGTDSSYSEKSEYVIYDGENADSPILLKENFPEIEGVAVVCAGGDSVQVKEKIINCVTALFNLPSNRVSVSKMNTQD
ncbi:MAG: hypothetical protein LUH82_00255 [Clostridiales bacterium]|nr:hypothetical protein [Clostridiales bacterium]